jgi:hypothetical protein
MKILSAIKRFHHGNAVRTLYVLRRILASGNINSRDNVTSLSVEAAESSSHGRTSKVLEHIKLYQGPHVSLQHLPHYITLDDCLAHY